MLTRSSLVAAAVVAVAAFPAAVHAQLDEIYNPGFEIAWPGDPERPDGWGLFNTALRRVIGDGYSPPAVVRTGEASLELPSGADFSGATTDVLNPETFEFYNLNYEWQGGTVIFSGWYYIPSDMPLVGANAGLKLEFRRPEPDNSIYQAFEALTISGHTNDTWQHFELVVHDEDFTQDFPPFPNRVSLLPIRFGDPNATGTIFWDDLHFEQGEDCYADFDNNGVLNLFDFLAYTNAFNAGDPAADCTGDGQLNLFDFLCFTNAFNEGC